MSCLPQVVHLCYLAARFHLTETIGVNPCCFIIHELEIPYQESKVFISLFLLIYTAWKTLLKKKIHYHMNARVEYTISL